MKNFPTHSNTPCGRPAQHPVHFGNINYTAEQINALLGMIPFKADRAEVPQMEKLSDINYIGHVPDASMLTNQVQPSWALVGSLTESRPYFFYVEGFVPKGYVAGWNDVSDVLGTYNLTADKVSIYDFSLVTEYNVSHNHTHLAKVFNQEWAAIPYRSYEKPFIAAKKYKKGDCVNMPEYTLYTFRATAYMQNIPPFVEQETNAFTFDEAIAITPTDYRIPGIKLTFINRMDGKAYTYFFRGQSADLWTDVQSWQVIDYIANDEVYRTTLFDRFTSHEEINGAEVTEADLKEVTAIIQAVQADKVVSFYYDPDKSSVAHFGTLDCYINETLSEFGCYISTIDGYFIARCNVRTPGKWTMVKMSSGDGGGTAPSSYNQLTERPSINNVLLTGNHTENELGIPSFNDLEQVNRTAETAKNAVATLEGLANATTAMETLAGQVVQIEENKQNIVANKAEADDKLAELELEIGDIGTNILDITGGIYDKKEMILVERISNVYVRHDVPRLQTNENYSVSVYELKEGDALNIICNIPDVKHFGVIGFASNIEGTDLVVVSPNSKTSVDVNLFAPTTAKYAFVTNGVTASIKRLVGYDFKAKLNELNDRTLNIKPINLFEWGRLNALGFYTVNLNYEINEAGHIITQGTMLLDIPVKHLVGKRIFFGFHSNSNYIEYGYFYNGSAQLSDIKPVFSIIKTDENGLTYRTLSFPSNENIVPIEATILRIQFRNNVELAEIYAGEIPYTGDTQYEIDNRQPEVYKYIGGSESIVQENTGSYASLKGNSTINENGEIEIESGGYSTIDMAFKLDLSNKLKGRKVYMNVKIDSESNKATSISLYCYKVVNGVFNNIVNSTFSIVSGEYTISPIVVPLDTNYIRLTVKTATSEKVIIKSLSFAETKHYSSDVKIYDGADALSEFEQEMEEKVLVEKETLYDAMKANLKKVLVGSKVFRKVSEKDVEDIISEINEHKVYYTPTNKLQKKAENVIIVDTKGTIQDSYNRGRVLEWVTPDGWMYFRNAYNRFERIKVEDFLDNLIAHDGSGIESSKIEWLDLQESQTETEKAEKLSQELGKWKMFDDSKSSLFETVYTQNSVGWITRQMSNGSLVNQQRLIRKDGSVITPKLNNPIIGNPTHLIIKENGVVLYELALKDAAHADGIKWGEMKADQGNITYSSNIFAAINWNDGKEISIDGINLVSGHTYEFTLRGRRYGTNCSNGSVQILSSDVLGSIILEDEIKHGANNSAHLVDNSTTITINRNLQGITLRAVAPTKIDFVYGNGASSTPNWGFSAVENYMLITEYVAEKRSGLAYVSKDYGESYDVLFDVSLNELFCNVGGGHIHGGCIDGYWGKVILVFGDLEFAKGIYHTDLLDNTCQDNVEWTREVPPNPFYDRHNGEQYCSAFACGDFIMFGTDTTPTGIFRMPRLNRDRFTPREPSKIICEDVLSHVPSMFFRANENSPIFIATMVGGWKHPIREYNTSIYHCTWDGININEIFKDNVRCGGFGNNAYMGVWYYNGKVFMTQHGDNRFENNHTLFVGDYKV